MEFLTFGEQVKIVLSRKGMTIKELAELIEERTGKKMSRQNLTQRLGRDNFQEQDMRLIASILECPFTLDIMSGVEKTVTPKPARTVAKPAAPAEPAAEEVLPVIEAVEEVAATEVPVEETPAEDERDITIGEIFTIHNELEKMETGELPVADIQEALSEDEFLEEEFEEDWDDTEPAFEPVLSRRDAEEDRVLGEVNPYTGREYQSNSVRMHPKRIGYVQVYDRTSHSWTDMTEWAFLGFQERQKALLGKDYEPPIYLD